PVDRQPGNRADLHRRPRSERQHAPARAATAVRRNVPGDAHVARGIETDVAAGAIGAFSVGDDGAVYPYPTPRRRERDNTAETADDLPALGVAPSFRVQRGSRAQRDVARRLDGDEASTS